MPTHQSTPVTQQPLTRGKKWTSFDMEVDLGLHDPKIRRDSEVLQFLRDKVRRNILVLRRQGSLKSTSPLYANYGTPIVPTTRTEHAQVQANEDLTEILLGPCQPPRPSSKTL